ncbi:MAG: TIGR03905 family TSCPD domain-containing protein [Muribaculaceae bacterium]|nr:TIGR03905 family TSCPD domain-containing protein [Muribaculaceae bacterium]
MKYQYSTQGTCSYQIDLDVEDSVIKDIQFYGGCDGNLQGICSLVRGMKVEDVLPKIEGIRCGMKTTSCPDQLARALRQVMAAKK